MERISCAAHIINNVLSKSSKQSIEFSEVIEKCKALVRYFKKSTNLQIQLKTTLKNCCDTRWNSTLFMLKSIRENYNEIIQVLSTRNCISKIQDISTNFLDETINFLEPFNTASEKLQQSNQPTLYLCYPHFYALKNKCQLNDLESELMKSFKQNVSINLKIWEEEITISHLTATFLLPKCKNLPMITIEKKRRGLQIYRNNFRKISTCY